MCLHSWRQLSAFRCALAPRYAPPSFPLHWKWTWCVYTNTHLLSPTLFTLFCWNMDACHSLFPFLSRAKSIPLAYVLQSQEWPISSGCPFLFCFPVLLTRRALAWWNMYACLFSSCPYFFFSLALTVLTKCLRNKLYMPDPGPPLHHLTAPQL